MLLDANLLLYAVNADAPEHPAAKAWLESVLNGPRRVGIPWESLTAFLRIATSPRVFARPLAPDVAWSVVSAWLAAPVTWVPVATDRHHLVLEELFAKYRPSGRAVPDTHLAALAIEHGAEILSADTDFARFSEIRWRNPLAG